MRTGVTRVSRRRAREGVVFCFHNVVDLGEAAAGDASLHVPAQEFAAIAGWIADTYEVVPLAEIADRVSRGISVHRLAALTFDDAYRGVFAHALPELRLRRLPATVFLVTDASEHPEFFWWDRLAAAGKLSAAERTEHLHALAGSGAEILRRSGVSGDHALPVSYLPTPWADVQGSLGNDLTIGSHTVSHRNLAALAPAELRRELVNSRRLVEERFGAAPSLVSYPYGLHDERVLREARQAGYRGGVTMRYGGVGRCADPLGLPRVNVPARISLDALECWAAGYRFRAPL